MVESGSGRRFGELVTGGETATTLRGIRRDAEGAEELKRARKRRKEKKNPTFTTRVEHPPN